jgi:hypothetical protein
MRLVDALPLHDAQLVDPSLWPIAEPGAIAPASQTSAASVATIPA